MGLRDASTAISKLCHSVRQYGGSLVGTQGESRYRSGLPNLVHSLGAKAAPHVRATHRRPPVVAEPHRIPAVWLGYPLPATSENGLWKAAFAEASILARRR